MLFIDIKDKTRVDDARNQSEKDKYLLTVWEHKRIKLNTETSIIQDDILVCNQQLWLDLQSSCKKVLVQQ